MACEIFLLTTTPQCSRRPHRLIHACVVLYILMQTQDYWSHKTRVFPLRGTTCCAKLWKSVFALPSLSPTVFLNTMNSDVLLGSCRSAVFLLLYSREVCDFRRTELEDHDYLVFYQSRTVSSETGMDTHFICGLWRTL